MILHKHPLDAVPRHVLVWLVRSFRWKVNDGVGCTVASAQDLKQLLAEPRSRPQTPNTGAIRTGAKGWQKKDTTAVSLSG